MSKGRPQGRRGKSWETYEQATAHILRRLSDRLRIESIEGKQKLKGRLTGARWEVDARAVDMASGTLVVVEARRHTRSRLNQEAIAAVAYRIQDLGASGAIVVSPHPLQKGARLVAAANNIRSIHLTPESTPGEWVATFGSLIDVGFADILAATVTDSLEIVVRNARGEIVEQMKA